MKLTQILNELNSADLTIQEKNAEPFDIKGSIKSISEYNSYGKELRRPLSIMEISKKIKSAVDAASKISLEEISDDEWFDRKTIERNMNEAKKYADEFDKIATDIHKKELQLEALFDEIGHKLSRYYKIN